ncbi:hypothetical protein P8X24_04825 [Pyrococcus kukulkanii]|uniref:hypothetical protein n=1 Tax=Pyrococcus kukulkanii TaxID=1609559 RepID=UPI0035629F92
MMDDVLKKAKEYSFVVGLLEDLYTLLYSQDERPLGVFPYTLMLSCWRPLRGM